jgi:hypothetical protein
MGLGLGIIAAMAFDETRDIGLTAISADHLFESNITRIALRRGVFPRRFEYDFIRFFAPHLDKWVVDSALQGEGEGDVYQV